MSAIWLILYLGSLVHLLVLNGFGLKHPASLIVLLPVAAALVLPPVFRRQPRLLPAGLVRAAGLLGFACTLVFVKSVYLEAWDTRDLILSVAIAGAGLGSLLPTLAGLGAPNAGTWLWVAFWLGAGLLDPALPLLGAGLGGMLAGSGLGLDDSPIPADPPLARPWLALFLLGFALSKPWWDFGIEREWAWVSASVGLGAAFATVKPVARQLSRLPASSPVWVLGALALLYTPALGVPWGVLLGLAAGSAWPGLPRRPLPTERVAAAFLLGLVLSFGVHANAWIPGLRHLIWLGN
jgi:hypothetical protein